jgi:hypothetical protein
MARNAQSFTWGRLRSTATARMTWQAQQNSLSSTQKQMKILQGCKQALSG